jgi:hypothetical protein
MSSGLQAQPAQVRVLGVGGVRYVCTSLGLALAIGEEQLKAAAAASSTSLVALLCCHADVGNLVHLKQELASQYGVVEGLQAGKLVARVSKRVTEYVFTRLGDTAAAVRFVGQWRSLQAHCYVGRQRGQAAEVEIAVKQLLQDELKLNFQRPRGECRVTTLQPLHTLGQPARLEPGMKRADHVFL